MKKFLLIFTLLAVFSTSLIFAQDNSSSSEEHEKGWSSLSYVNVPVFKIFEGKEAYIVVYQKNRVGVGNVVIPKKWASGSNDSPRKLKFRAVRTAENAYLTVVKKDGEFLKVILNVPMSKANPIWAVADYHKQIEGSDKDSLEELEL